MSSPGFVAEKMGLPVARFAIGSNSNDILTRFFETGAMTMAGVVPTISPSMDIQVSSNFERLLFDLCGRDGAAVERMMLQFPSVRQLCSGRNCPVCRPVPVLRSAAVGCRDAGGDP